MVWSWEGRLLQEAWWDGPVTSTKNVLVGVMREGVGFLEDLRFAPEMVLVACFSREGRFGTQLFMSSSENIVTFKTISECTRIEQLVEQTSIPNI